MVQGQLTSIKLWCSSGHEHLIGPSEHTTIGDLSPLVQKSAMQLFQGLRRKSRGRTRSIVTRTLRNLNDWHQENISRCMARAVSSSWRHSTGSLTCERPPDR